MTETESNFAEEVRTNQYKKGGCSTRREVQSCTH